jgi:hypothetical protein
LIETLGDRAADGEQTEETLPGRHCREDSRLLLLLLLMLESGTIDNT